MKETFYFSHDYNARSDWKLVKVAMKHGMEWVGAYWCIVEMLYEEWWYLNIEEYERITFELRISYELVESLINNFSLFNKDDTRFWSDSILDRLKQRMDKSEKARLSVQKRWDKKNEENTNVLRTKNECNTIKERKGKEIKEKNNKETVSKDTEQAPNYIIEKEYIDSTEIKSLVTEPIETFWKDEINLMQWFLRQAVWLDKFKDSKERWYVTHCYNLMKKIGKEEFQIRLKEILSDPFKAKNCNKLAYLYWELKSYIHTPVIEPKQKVSALDITL